MIIKLECYCGMKYEFNVEPVDGRMPYEISCPNCDGDGTEYANLYIAQVLASQPDQPGLRQERRGDKSRRRRLAGDQLG